MHRGARLFTTGSRSGRGAVLGLGLLGFALAAGQPARAADDGYENVFSSVLDSVGIIKSDPPPEIEYRERPPLVLPPSATLPKPASAPQRSAAWPQDPDVLKRRKASADARAPNSLDPSQSNKGILLSKDELLKGRGQDEPVRPNTCGNDGNQRGCLVINPDELKAENDRWNAANPQKTDTLVAGKEPPREWLTEPPKGYMKPAKTMKATAEAPELKLDPGSPRYDAEMAAKKAHEDQ